MVDFIKIEKDVKEKLNGVGLAKEGENWLAYRVLFHLFAADEMLHQMWKPQFDNVKEWYGRVFKTVFVKKLLRETKKPKKSHLPPIPPTMVKETKVKTEIKQTNKGGALLFSLDERKKAFYADCHKYDERYGIDKAKEEHVSYAEYKRTKPESTLEMDLSQVRESIGRRLDKPG